ncbi:HORMA-1 domain-containing protein [Hymenobacter pini]|uniref:HORMA-1 domain-containing protein n=1 Tax=Hymenobacter pini TaxID=2880879 RepID=UPI001CF1ED93|nr:hypothetical protein [Hymenobacter pini]MCA8833344.1 hypothetical protein [Hymenobacter pini]
MSTYTQTTTRTTTDVQKTFQGFKADLGMIAMRTSKWTQAQVDFYFHDVLKLAENSYLRRVDIILHNSLTGDPIRVATYTVNNEGTAMDGGRAGGNDWPNLANTHLSLLLHYTSEWSKLTPTQQSDFEGKLNGAWSPSSINSSYPHLTREAAQLYATNGYELQKQNLK